MTSGSRTTSNQRWNNVVYVNVDIYNVQERWNSILYFNIDFNNVRQRQNIVIIFNVNFYNVGQRRNNVVNMTIWKKKLSLDSKTIIFSSFKEYAGLTIFFFFPPF